MYAHFNGIATVYNYLVIDGIAIATACFRLLASAVGSYNVSITLSH